MVVTVMFVVVPSKEKVNQSECPTLVDLLTTMVNWRVNTKLFFFSLLFWLIGRLTMVMDLINLIDFELDLIIGPIGHIDESNESTSAWPIELPIDL